MDTDHLTERVNELEAECARLRGWMRAMYKDMLRLQHASAKAMAGKRDEANAIYREVLENSEKFTGAQENE